MRAPGAGLSVRCCGGGTVYRITRVRRVVSPPSLPPPSAAPLAVISRSFSSFLSLHLASLSRYLSLLELYFARVSSLSISTVVDVSVETEDPTTPPANHAAAGSSHPRPFPRESKAKADYGAIIARAAGAGCSCFFPSLYLILPRRGQDFSIWPSAPYRVS